MRAVLDVVFDRPDWFEVQPKFGPAIICALAHLGGHPVAVVANQPKVLAGSIDADAADKAAHFIMVADSFHLPIVFLADNPGMLPGSRSEKSGVLRSGARMFAAQTAATTLKLHVTLRKAYGFGSMVMSLLGFDNQSATFAFPGATMGAMSAAALSRASHAAEDVEAKLRKMEVEASFRSASHLGFDDLIHPEETREALLVGVAARNLQPAGGSGTGEPHRHHALALSDFGALAYAQRVLARRNHSCLRPRNTLLNGNSVARPVFHRRVGRSQQTCRRGVLRIP